ncbi:MAG: thiamine biosynthesis protein ThiS [Microthrixaceae bacterium]
MSVVKLLRELGVDREAVLVMADRELIAGDATLRDDAEVEIRPVISGGAV